MNKPNDGHKKKKHKKGAINIWWFCCIYFFHNAEKEITIKELILISKENATSILMNK